VKSKNLQKLESEVNRLYDRLQASHAERDKYKAALDKIAEGRIDWTIEGSLTKTRAEFFQEIARGAVKSE
tara:strand:- start:1275 stop:1484 length:210 start_codon:yes stop_codon:yes gene_type:complete